MRATSSTSNIGKVIIYYREKRPQDDRLFIIYNAVDIWMRKKDIIECFNDIINAFCKDAYNDPTIKVILNEFNTE